MMSPFRSFSGQSARRLLASLALILLPSVLMAQEQPAIVQVNGKPVTERDLQLQFLTRNIPEEQQPALREKFLNDLIEQRLVQEYLQEQKVRVNKARAEESLAKVYQIIREADRDPAEVLARLGLDENMLRQELMLPLAWQVHLEEKVPPEKLRQFYESRHQQFDGTKLRLRQIFLRISEGEADSALNKLTEIKKQIESGTLDFAAAARQFSQAPTASEGGDLGFVPYQGEMPVTITGPAFELKQGEISEPYLSPFGAHLVQVVDVQPGELSLEDVRRDVWHAMSAYVWQTIVDRRRADAKIDWAE